MADDLGTTMEILRRNYEEMDSRSQMSSYDTICRTFWQA
jgi:hypothetical protein